MIAASTFDPRLIWDASAEPAPYHEKPLQQESSLG
jgi:uncharacterized paraquat-inducible protein A